MLIGLSLFQRLQEPINQLPPIISDLVEAIVSLKRIENYLKQPDIIEIIFIISNIILIKIFP